MNNKSLASKLKNRIEIYRLIEEMTDIGITLIPKFYKTVWADIIPMSSGVVKEDSDTSHTETKFKIIIRKTDIKQSDIIKYKGLEYDIQYIIPNFDNKGYLEVFTILRKG